jgi:hypothetical protein
MRLRLTCTILSLTACASADPDLDDAVGHSCPAPEIVYCADVTACPADPQCGAWWCDPLQESDPGFGSAWGRCRVAPTPDGTPCDDGAGRCDNRVCNSPR